MKHLLCNKCGKKIEVFNGISREDFIKVSKAWGFFSKKDGMTQEFIICEACMEQLEKDFVISSRIYETTELI